jgi:hypothetical protein
MGEVYYSGANVVTTKIKLPFGISAFDLYVEPDMFSTYKITVTVIDSSLATLTQEINGFGGAKYSDSTPLMEVCFPRSQSLTERAVLLMVLLWLSSVWQPVKFLKPPLCWVY